MLFQENIVSDGATTVYQYKDPAAIDSNGNLNTSHPSIHFNLSFTMRNSDGMMNNFQIGNLIYITEATYGSNFHCIDPSKYETDHRRWYKFTLLFGDNGMLVDPDAKSNYTSGGVPISGGLKMDGNSLVKAYYNTPGIYPSAAELASGQISLYASTRSGLLRQADDPVADWVAGTGACDWTINCIHNFTLPDLTAPTITGPNYPASDIVIVGSEKYVKSNSITVSYSATDTESGVAGIWIDGVQASSSGSASKTYTGPTPFTTEAYAEDVAGNQSAPTSSESFKFDNNPPTVAIQAQNPKVIGGKDYYNGTVDIQIDTDDNESGLDNGDLIINGTTTSFTTTTGQTTYTKTIGPADGIIEGVNAVEYVSKDKVGNQDSDTVVFYVDKTKPDGYIIFSAGNKIRSRGGTLYTKETNVDVDLHFGDAGADPSGVTKGLIQINNSATPSVGSFASGISLSSSPKTSHNVTGLVSGQVNTLTFFVIDAVDNISTGDTISVTVEQVDPSGSIQISSAETPKITKSTTNYINDGVVELNVTHSDSESDLF